MADIILAFAVVGIALLGGRLGRRTARDEGDDEPDVRTFAKVAHSADLADVEVEGWHGGWGSFNRVNETHLGSGEGAAQGWGFYLSEFREGGQWYARYLHFREKQGFLHRVSFSVAAHEFWDMERSDKIMLSDGAYFTTDDYYAFRRDLGDKNAAACLRDIGIKAFRVNENNNPNHGLTCVVVDPRIVNVAESFEYLPERADSQWRRLD